MRTIVSRHLRYLFVASIFGCSQTSNSGDVPRELTNEIASVESCSRLMGAFEFEGTIENAQNGRTNLLRALAAPGVKGVNWFRTQIDPTNNEVEFLLYGRDHKFILRRVYRGTCRDGRFESHFKYEAGGDGGRQVGVDTRYFMRGKDNSLLIQFESKGHSYEIPGIGKPFSGKRSGSACLNNFPRLLSGNSGGLTMQSYPRRRACSFT